MVFDVSEEHATDIEGSSSLLKMEVVCSSEIVETFSTKTQYGIPKEQTQKFDVDCHENLKT
jgi:hypothetical protein